MSKGHKARRWKPDELTFLYLQNSILTDAEVAAALNRTNTAVQTKRMEIKLLKPEGFCNSKSVKTQFKPGHITDIKWCRKRKDSWKEEEIEVLKREWNTLSSTDIAGLIGRTPFAVKTKAKELKIKKNKETLRLLAMRRNTGQFIKGRRPAVEIPLFTVSTRVATNGAGSKWIKLGDKNWIQLHHYNWQQAGNKIPKGYVLRFKDADQLNCELENLELILRGRHQMKDQVGVVQRRKNERAQRKLERQLAAEEKRKNKAAPREKKTVESGMRRALRKAQRLADKEAAAAERLAKKETARAEKLQLKQLKAQLKQMAKDLAKLSTAPVKVAPVVKKIAEPRVKAASVKKVKQTTGEKTAKSEDEIRKQQERELKQLAKSKIKAIKLNKEIKKSIEAENRQKFTTRVIDTSALIPLRLDNNTVVYIKPGQDPEQVKAKYRDRDKNSYTMKPNKSEIEHPQFEI